MVIMEYNGKDLRFRKKENNKVYNRVIPLCDSRPFPEFRDSSTQIEGADGEWFDSQTIGPREFTITLVANGRLIYSSEDLQALARDIGKTFMVREPKRFTFSDERDPGRPDTQLYRLAVPTGVFDAEEFIRAGRWTCRFRQLDPFLYGYSRSEALKANTATEITVGGNAPAANLVAKTTPKNGVKRYELAVVGGQSIAFKANFDNSTELTVNFRNQTARIDKSITAEGLATGSRFFDFGGTLKLKANSLTTLTWTERWL